MNPRVRNVVAKDDYTLEITFTNGERGVFHCEHLLTFGVFQEFQDLDYFKQAHVEHGTVVWPHEQDICPDTLYEDSTKVPLLNAGKTLSPEPRTPSLTADTLPALGR